MTTPRQQILDKCKEISAIALRIYGLDLKDVGIRFDLRGRAAGMACANSRQFYMRFNADMLTREAFDHVLNETVPHEIAHIVCFKNPTLGRNHNPGWKRVCKALGGTGERCHQEKTVNGKGTTYEYVTDRGNKVRVGDRYHLQIQNGSPLKFRKGLGTVSCHAEYNIVGHRGKTLATPIVKNSAQTKEVPVTVIIPQETVITKSTSAGFAAGASKASIARSIMLAGHSRGMNYEDIITAIMHATGHERQLARATYKANQKKVGI